MAVNADRVSRAIPCQTVAWLMMNRSRTLRQNSAYFSVEVDGERLLYRPGSQNAMHLDTIAALIWQMCDGSRTADDIAAELSSFYPDDAGTVQGEVLAAIENLFDGDALVHEAAGG